MANYLSAAEAARQLGVSRQTLYAYVSRGLLRAHEASDPRQSRYESEAVARLAEQRRRGRRPKEVAKATLDWGLPVLESAITLIQDGRLYYRGVDVVGLAQSATLEEVAALLWRLPVPAAFGPNLPVRPAVGRNLPTRAVSEPDPPVQGVIGPVLPVQGVIGPDLPVQAAVATKLLGGVASGTPRSAVGCNLGSGSPEETLLPAFAAATGDDGTASWQRDPRRLAEGCGGLVRILAACLTGAPPGTAPLHQQLADAWKLDREAADLVRMALVFCADHELNASSFTARCVASTGASLRAAVIGGLAALSGGRHGGATGRIETFWRGLDATRLAADLRRRLAADGALAGFGHPLYPGGDIRARVLLEHILPQFPAARDLVAAADQLTGHAPNIDFALVTLRRFLRLPEGSAFGLFALGRSVGWIAHAIEQRETGQLIRPRAVYTGPLPAVR